MSVKEGAASLACSGLSVGREAFAGLQTTHTSEITHADASRSLTFMDWGLTVEEYVANMLSP